MIYGNFNDFVSWLNDNQGVVSLAIFILTLLLGWVSGIFSALRKRPKFKIGTIDGPTFCCTYNTGNTFNGHDAHITAFAIYLKIANIGSASSSIEKIQIGYHWNIIPFSFNWLKYRFLGWFWLKEQVIALDDFQVKIGDKIKVYPFLTQLNKLSPAKVEKYIEVGKGISGVVYFEQQESWGAMSPVVHNKITKIKICIVDSFGKKHKKILKIPVVQLNEAFKYNPSFGMTYHILNDEKNISKTL
ncbi:hypothetical protein H0S56_06150 [Acinetobacter lwoffii]|uniref:hypothetical protein n=2 Tax=Acinetobacter TaxID=469 RepID=UPI00189DC5EF|nr:hypothetical protein [Acinetobacter lwoffii]QPF33219.1 hypothetical protein H0S56_06150 [Acinetobacter lwoffii]